MEKSIIVNNVSKKYKLYQNNKNRLLDLVSPKNYGEDFYALKNVSFEANKGDIIGFVGINGSGKSTLSNIIAGIVPQTLGTVKVNGETSIIAVSAGLKADLSGRDNIELKCLMLGFNKKQIKKLEPKIIEFSELGQFIDQPVKSYSSGMRSRLGFAISVNVDPEILIIDEALSVGDKAFAEKSFKKMQDFKDQGKTMIFVSHSIRQMEKFCEKILWLEFGRVKAYGKVNEIIPKYESFLRKWRRMAKEEREIYMRSSLNNVHQLEVSNKSEKKQLNKPFKEEVTSRICKIKSKISPFIYQLIEKIGMESVDSKLYADCSYYCKRQIQIESETYYLLSKKPSGINGLVGWVASSELNSRLHIFIDEDIKFFKLKGRGKGYNMPWGGKENLIIPDLTVYKDKQFKVFKTEKVGKHIWYFGEVENKQVWIHKNHLI